jgi:hypothetical protein
VCYRCGKKEEIVLEAADLQGSLMNDSAKKEYVAHIREVLSELDAKMGPEIIICTKAADGYAIEMLDNLCETKGNSESSRKFRGCKNKVANLLNEAVHKSKADRAAEVKE